jgi:restriction endonuclease BglII
MKHSVHNFRLAREILSEKAAWKEFQQVVKALDSSSILDFHRQLSVSRAPAGGQSAINAYFDAKLRELKWTPQPHLFESERPDLRRWKMDFTKDKIGVEISFNHAEAIPWIFTRLNIAGESDRVQPTSKIEVGVAVFAMESLKKWAKMDGAVGTFELATAWLKEMKPILPIPIFVIGLDAEAWKATTAFRGTGKGTRIFAHKA